MQEVQHVYNLYDTFYLTLLKNSFVLRWWITEFTFVFYLNCIRLPKPRQNNSSPPALVIFLYLAQNWSWVLILQSSLVILLDVSGHWSLLLSLNDVYVVFYIVVICHFMSPFISLFVCLFFFFSCVILCDSTSSWSLYFVASVNDLCETQPTDRLAGWLAGCLFKVTFISPDIFIIH